MIYCRGRHEEGLCFVIFVRQVESGMGVTSNPYWLPDEELRRYNYDANDRMIGRYSTSRSCIGIEFFSERHD